MAKSHITLRNEKKTSLPAEFGSDDVRYCEELVEHFLKEFTAPENVVFDPFLGFGTTLVVAERMNRNGYGIEFDEARLKYAQSLMEKPERAIHGDSTKLQEILLPKIDFCITSPPYMGKHHKENPFTAYTTDGAGYDQYLRDLKSIYVSIDKKMNPAAHAIIEVANLKHEAEMFTTLAWDIAREVSDVMRFQGETIIIWEDGYGYGYDHSYALLFQKN